MVGDANEDRYHHLNHFAIFGGGYRGSAVRIMDRLIKKFGNDG
jgi:fructosamine-3-kinase